MNGNKSSIIALIPEEDELGDEESEAINALCFQRGQRHSKGPTFKKSHHIQEFPQAMAILGPPMQNILETRHVDSAKVIICRRSVGR
jgi:hypothetical protein